MSENALTSDKTTLILSAIRDKDPSGKEFYSQTETLGDPIAHTKGANETYYRIYTVTVTTNYDALKAADAHGELDTLIGELTQKYTLYFDAADPGAGEGEVRQDPEFALLGGIATTAIDTDDEVAAEFGGSNVETVTVSAATKAGIQIAANTVSNSNKSWTYYLVTYMNGVLGSGHHDSTKTYVGKVAATHSAA